MSPDDGDAGPVSLDQTDRRRWPMALVPALVVALALGAVVVSLRSDPGADPATSGSASTTTSPGDADDAVAVTSDAVRVASLEELIGAADLVVRAEVVATERGRWFGDGGDGARIQSRLVTLRVDDVLAGPAPGAPSILVEEEGWTEDGAPLVVDGAPPSRVGDDGVWFLLDGGDPDLGAYVVVSAQGRYLVAGDGGSLQGADLDDGLVDELSTLTVDELATAVRAAR